MLTRERVRIIVKAIRSGNTRQCAANLAGISFDTLQSWLQKGREGHPVYAGFAEQIALADGRIEARMVDNLVKCGPMDWRASRAWLGTRRAKTWGEKSTLDVKVQRATELEPLSDEDLDQLLALVAKAKKGSPS
jgi:hypothetical protein